MPKIITVTANTAVDYVLEVHRLSLGDTVIAEKAVKFASGKGVNVGRAVATLGCPVQMLGFVGAKSQALFQGLDSDLVTTDFSWVAGETRTNLTVFDPKQQQETHIRTVGFSVTAADCQSLIAKFNACVHHNDIVVLSGSLPTGAPSDFYATLISLCHAKSAVVFLDSSGESLRLGVEAKPFLIKPNQQEFASLLGHHLEDEQAMIAAARDIVATGVNWVVVSKAEQGALMVGDSIALAVLVSSDDGQIVSQVGCGDALIAGLVFAKQQGYAVPEMLKLAVACGTANVFSVEPGQFELEKLAQMREQVQVRVL